MTSLPLAAHDGPGLRVLAVVELGSNWGHLLRLLPVVRALGGRGHEITLAVADPERARRVFAGEGVDIVICPGALVNADLGERANLDHYAELLDRCVIGDDETLAATVAQWAALLQSCRPDVLLTDFAPGALLAAHLHRLPLVQVAIGWEAPPAGPRLPIVRPWKAIDPRVTDALEATVLARINRWCEAHRVPALRTLSALYAVGTQLLATVPEADHFAPRGTARYIGPIVSASHGRPAAWQSKPTDRGIQRVLVYLAPDPRNLSIVSALKQLQADVIAILPKIGASTVSVLTGPRMFVSEEPVQLEPLLVAADLVISNGGHGLSLASLMAGVPLLALPQTTEQALAARRLASTGALRTLGLPLQFLPIIAAQLRDPAAREAARAFATKYAGSTQDRTIQSVIECVESAARCGVVPSAAASS